MTQFLLSVPYESQASDPESYAGARVIRMISRSLSGTPPDVVNVYTSARDYNDPNEAWPKWYIDPLGMQHGLYDTDPRTSGGFPGLWRIYTNPGQPAADNQLQSTLKTYNTAAAVLVNGGTHWVCVAGYNYDASNKVTSFIIHDPAYDGGGANLAVEIALWDSAFTPVSGGTRWLNQITEVGDPQPITDLLEFAPRRPLFPGDTLIEPRAVAKLAMEGAGELYGDMPNIRSAIERGIPGEPRLVARMDREGSYYYIVPLEVEGEGVRGRRAVGAIVIDARYGDVLSASGSEEAFSLWPIRPRDVRAIVTRAPIPVHDPIGDVADELLWRIMDLSWASPVRRDPGTTDEVPGQMSRAGLRNTIEAAIASHALPGEYLYLTAHDITIDPIMVWAPCRSVSLYHPYYVVRTPWRALYVNANSGRILSTAETISSFDFCGRHRLGA